MTKTTETFSPYDRADYLVDVETAAAYLEAALDEAGDDSAVIAQALGTIARSGNLSEFARRIGMSR
jgi:probable addiction module antidote protein